VKYIYNYVFIVVIITTHYLCISIIGSIKSYNFLN